MGELFWRKIRFIMLFLLASTLLFFILIKFTIKVPIVESNAIIGDIQHSEEILQEQKEYEKQVKSLHDSISKLDFNINQVQVLDEIKRDIHSLQDVYKRNNMNTKYIFGMEASRILRIYFDSREALDKIQRNNEKIEKNLNECKANI